MSPIIPTPSSKCILARHNKFRDKYSNISKSFQTDIIHHFLQRSTSIGMQRISGIWYPRYSAFQFFISGRIIWLSGWIKKVVFHNWNRNNYTYWKFKFSKYFIYIYIYLTHDGNIQGVALPWMRSRLSTQPMGYVLQNAYKGARYSMKLPEVMSFWLFGLYIVVCEFNSV